MEGVRESKEGEESRWCRGENVCVCVVLKVYMRVEEV
jgi:hypothetical protein